MTTSRKALNPAMNCSYRSVSISKGLSCNMPPSSAVSHPKEKALLEREGELSGVGRDGIECIFLI